MNERQKGNKLVAVRRHATSLARKIFAKLPASEMRKVSASFVSF
jgi:hypothetical protein